MNENKKTLIIVVVAFIFIMVIWMIIRATKAEPETVIKPSQQTVQKQAPTAKKISQLKPVIIDAIAGRKYIQEKFKQLNHFKTKYHFYETYGFGIGGPYNVWLKSVEKNGLRKYRSQSPYTEKQKNLIGNMWAIGFLYMENQGQGNEDTEKNHREIVEYLNGTNNDNYPIKEGW